MTTFTRVSLFLLLLLVFSWRGGFCQDDLSLSYLSTFKVDSGSAERVAYESVSARIFFTNSGKNVLTILDVSEPTTPNLISEIPLNSYGLSVKSVAIHGGLVAVAMDGALGDGRGAVAFFDIDGNFKKAVVVGMLPDMLAFTSDGQKVLTANEGEPNDDYTNDPEGSVSIIDLSSGVENAAVTMVTFTGFNDKKASLLNKGIRIYGPNATVAQDL